MKLLIAIYVFIASAAASIAQEAIGSRHERFGAGAKEIEALGGAVFSIDAGPFKPTFNFALATVRFGIMLTSPRESGWFPGNTELLFEGYGGGIFAGPGSGVGALNILLRRNILFPHAIVVPYAQVGGGGAYTDIASADKSEVLLGSELNFSAEAALGFRIIVSARCSLLLEHDFVHYSNAGSTSRNHGLNAIGGQAGLAYSF